MIGKLTGLVEPQTHALLINVQGVGYLVRVGTKLLATPTETELSLYIHTHVKEEALELYGFATLQEKELFLLLLSVSGVGPNIALNISDQGAEKIIQAVQHAQVNFFTQIPRVGKKLAQKIIIDLKGKLGSLKELQLGPTSPAEEIVVTALTNLGFDENQVLDYVKTIDIEHNTPEESIRQAIRHLGQHKIS